MGGIELPQLREGRFQRSPHPPERSGLLLDDLIVENVEGSAVKAQIAGHGLRITPHRSHAQDLSGLPIADNRPAQSRMPAARPVRDRRSSLSVTTSIQAADVKL